MAVVRDLVAICAIECTQRSSEGSVAEGRTRACEEHRGPGLSATASAGGLCRSIRSEVVQGLALCVGENRLRLAFHRGRRRLDCGGRSAGGWCSRRGGTCTSGRVAASCGASAGCDQYYHQEATSEQEKASKKHGRFSLRKRINGILLLSYLCLAKGLPCRYA